MLTKFKLRLAKWLTKDVDRAERYEKELAIPVAKVGRILDNDRNAVNFTIHHASGGYVVETNYYDNRKDEHNRSLHIITSQEDFSEELGKAVFMEMLKHR